MTWYTKSLSDRDVHSLEEFIAASTAGSEYRWYSDDLGREYEAPYVQSMLNWCLDWPALSDSVGYPRTGDDAEHSPRDVYTALEVYIPKRDFLEWFLAWESAYHCIDS
jgi:hypothetical protein